MIVQTVTIKINWLNNKLIDLTKEDLKSAFLYQGRDMLSLNSEYQRKCDRDEMILGLLRRGEIIISETEHGKA